MTTGFDPDNYRHIVNGDHVLWTDEMISRWQQRPEFTEFKEECSCFVS